MAPVPPLSDTLQICGGAGAVIGGFLAAVTTDSTRGESYAENVARGTALGGVCGTGLGFALYFVFRLNGGVG